MQTTTTTTTITTNAKLASKPYSRIPGDTRQVLTAPLLSADGRTWPRGTVYQPLSGGYDTAVRCHRADVTIEGERVIFFFA